MSGVLRLGDHVLKIGSGATPKGGKEAYLTKGPYALVRSQNVYNDGFTHSGLAYISEEQAVKLSNVELRKHDVLLNITGDSVARVCQVDPSILPARVNQHVAIIRPEKTVINPQFLRYFLASPVQQGQLFALASAGATRPALTKSMIENLAVPAFELSVQQDIADLLGVLDDKIALNQKMNETLEGMARAIFKDWFVDFGPVKAKERGEHPIGPDGEPMSDELLNLFPDRIDPDTGLPEGWKEKPFSHFVRIKRNAVRPGDVAEDEPYIGLEHMPRQSVALHQWDGAGKVTSNKSSFNGGDILFGKLRPYFHKVGIAPVSGICSTDIMVFEPKTAQYREFALICASSVEFVAHSDQASTGTRMPRANWKHVSEFQICHGSEPLVQAYSKMTRGMIAKITSNIHQGNTLAQLRDTLLPKLMSGAVSVDEIKAIGLADNLPAQLAVIDLFGEMVLTPDEELERDTVMVAAAVKALQVEDQVVGNVRYQKAFYFTRRKMGLAVDDFLPKAAGPYNHELKYGGGYDEALKRRYIRTKWSDDIEGNVIASNFAEIEPLVAKYQMANAIAWVRDRLRGKSRDELELWATVDQATLLLGKMDKEVNADTVVELIDTIPEWKSKLNRPIFSRSNIEKAIYDLNQWMTN